jgi:hypothetical protein
MTCEGFSWKEVGKKQLTSLTENGIRKIKGKRNHADSTVL